MGVQLDFLQQEVSFSWSIDRLVADALATILSLFEAGIPQIVGFSGGKDSSLVTNLTLTAAAQAVKLGFRPMVVVTSSDTLVESPEVTHHVRAEMAKMRLFGQRHGFTVETHIVTPSLLSTWQVKVLSGRGIPSYAGTSTDCSTDLKITPQVIYRNQLFRRIGTHQEPVTLLGLRFQESEKRAIAMRSRRESSTCPARNASGDLVLSVIAWWCEDDVYEYIGRVASGEIDCYSDFSELKRIYAAAEGTSCMVVADALFEGKVKKGGCGQRLGCWACQQAEDKSLEAMVAYDERYAYAKGLNRLNQFIRNIRYDWTRRHWIGRTIMEGFIAIEPDTFSPVCVREIFRYMLQLDYDEENRARAAGVKPMFRTLTLDMIVAVDAMWSLNGLAPMFAAWHDYDDVNSGRLRYDIPEIKAAKPTPIPPAKFLFVGKDWDDSAPISNWSGLRDVYMEGLTEGTCLPGLKKIKATKTIPAGRMAWDLETSQRLTVNAESLCMFLDFELPDILATRQDGRIVGGITNGYKWYLHYGLITLSHGLRADHDDKLRRTAFKDREGLTLGVDVDALLARAVRYADLPGAARKAWAHKATASGAQLEFLDFPDMSEILAKARRNDEEAVLI